MSPKRCLVYVNEATSRVIIHPERNGPCPHVFQQFIAGNTTMTTTVVDLSNGKKEVIKIAETKYKDSYWLIVYGKDIDEIINNQIVQNIAKKLKTSPELCTDCK